MAKGTVQLEVFHSTATAKAAYPTHTRRRRRQRRRVLFLLRSAGVTPDGFRVHARWSHAGAGAASGAPTSISSLKSALRPSSSPPPRRMASKGASCGIVGNCLAADHRASVTSHLVSSPAVSRAPWMGNATAHATTPMAKRAMMTAAKASTRRGAWGESGGRGWASRWRRLERSERS